MSKLIITCALCGVGTTKEQNPHVPITPDEIAADGLECVKAGASILHIHVRDAKGVNIMDKDIFVEVVGKIREKVAHAGLDVVINVTTSGSKFSYEQRMSHLALVKPEMCSYDPGTMNWANSYVFLNEPKFLEELGTLTQELGVKPEIEIFDAGMIGNVNYYLKKGFLKPPLHCQLVLGVPGGMPGTAESVAYLLPKLPADSTWSITGIGKDHVPCMLIGLAEGCNGLRVGLEDNIFFEKGVLATNPQLVARAVELGKLAGREIADAAEAREILGLTKKV
jgi:3-keto-5-aminohexanoate cleavage enzyme